MFNIATLNLSYSDIKKRQEVGRGLRICVNQDGERIYDPPNVEETERVNQLTVIPNETYETFIIQYQEEIKSIYGSISAGAGITHAHKGKPQNEQVFKLNTTNIIDKAFKRFWKILAKKTDYIVAFNEENLIKKSIEGINKLTIPDYVIEASSHFIKEFTEDGRKDDFLGTDYKEQVAKFTPLDLVGQLSEDTGISFSAICQIVKKLQIMIK
ncbi:MAG: hypothetical protein IPJ75_04950 [Ignavibacteriales bacterium]|nr:hypothetical protein [Ignavibacteriales bacterium]